MQNYEKQLRRLLPKERKILQYLSIYWEQITEFEFRILISEMGIKNHNGQEYSKHFVSVLQNSLVKKRLLSSTQRYWGKGFQIFSDGLKEYLMRESAESSWFSTDVKRIQNKFRLNDISPAEYSGKRYGSRLIRDFRISIYQKNQTQVNKLYQEIRALDYLEEASEVIVNAFAYPFQDELLGSFESNFQEIVLEQLFKKSFTELESTTELWDFVDQHEVSKNRLDRFRFDELLFQGDIAKLKRLTGNSTSLENLLTIATISLLEGNIDATIDQFELYIGLWRKTKRKRNGYPDNWQIFLYALVLFKKNQSKFREFTVDFYAFFSKSRFQPSVLDAVKAFDLFLQNNDRLAQESADRIEPKGFQDKFLGVLVSAIVPILEVPFYADDLVSKVDSLNYDWLSLELHNLLSVKGRHNKRSKAQSDKLELKLGFSAVGKLIPPIEDWKRVMHVLKLVAENKVGHQENETRVAWRIDFVRKEIQPVEQKLGRSDWTKGRVLQRKELLKSGLNLTKQDRSVIQSALKTDDHIDHYSSSYYSFDWESAVLMLVGHPLLFLSKNPLIGITLTKNEPRLTIHEKQDNQLEISFDIDIKDVGYVVQKETETRYNVVEVTEQHLLIAEALSGKKLLIPSEGRESLVKTIQLLSKRIAVQSDLKEHFEHLPSVESDSRIHALITPVDKGFHLEFFVKPFGEMPPYMKPGRGSRHITAEIEGVRTRTTRNMPIERQLLTEIEESCPFLAEFETPNYEWNLTDTEACLKAMIEMQIPRQEGKLVVEWTKGQKLKFLGSVNYSNLSVAVTGENNWFDISGSVKIDDNLVLSLKELLRLADQSTSEFIELSDGKFIAITERLRKHLYSLNAVVDEDQRLHKLRSGILQQFSDEVKDFQANANWDNHLEKIKEAANFEPKIPEGINAEFRPYQIKGYFWLSRLAYLGVGACLADDMGLGKTLQALAIILQRSDQGPALVVAPVSVIRNWKLEASRFAPGLKVKIFGENDREETMENLGKGDVLVSSYSMVQQESELFSSTVFETIVLDEAQAIKNRNTKRSKAIMNLNGKFRILTTGTPIENHLGELWNLFNFINPGLLGSHRFFNARFAVPIERDNSHDARNTLQKLIAPYILRRTKDQVLTDLPEKTEITLSVEMSDEERSFYEAIRLDALKNIEGEGQINDKRFRIFAELMKLRLACCHPQLVNKDIAIDSSKLSLFAETLGELLENNHKALVFSQFVKHLQIVKKYLKDQGIDFQYLDGSTPAKARQKRIDAFQRGEGDVFLISLKAGGTGLNLTAADYVIHLDPWWNPAVEDQATDRVHRIGQGKPVTVYRLITSNTVEEKILRLHSTKRDLADSLLTGTDSSGKLSLKDLLALISEP